MRAQILRNLNLHLLCIRLAGSLCRQLASRSPQEPATQTEPPIDPTAAFEQNALQMGRLHRWGL